MSRDDKGRGEGGIQEVYGVMKGHRRVVRRAH